MEQAGHQRKHGSAPPDRAELPHHGRPPGEGGPRLKYQANIAAIRLLKELEAAGRQASPDQQEVLSRYVGWGGVPEAFDPSKTAWAKEYAELKELLTPEEYEAARASTLNAHYTSPMVIRAIYEAVEQMGFHSGNILEPSCGVGNFFGMLPESMSESKLYGVELDSITGRIARHLYPNARIEVNGFEKTQYPDGVFDLAIGNVPFGNYRVSDRPYDRHNLLIHDYFFAKAIDKVRAGGIIAFITSNGISGGTMDKRTRTPESIWPGAVTCWARSACRTPPSGPMPGQILRWTLFSCKSGRFPGCRASRCRNGWRQTCYAQTLIRIRTGGNGTTM